MEDTAKDIEIKVRDTENIVHNPAQIKGWGVDADPENDPTYPMKNRNNGEHAGYSWDRPTQQTASVEILHSNERPNLSATFGTSTPPSGLSGVLRRAAFKYSENSYGHWLPLMLADRINVVEGILSDVAGGQFPNVLGEMGMKAEWQHNKKRVITRVAVGAAIAFVAVSLLRKRRREEESYYYEEDSYYYQED
jgi:hypothetical protein